MLANRPRRAKLLRLNGRIRQQAGSYSESLFIANSKGLPYRASASLKPPQLDANTT